MSPEMKQIEAEARQLAPRERAELAQRLFATLEEDDAPRADGEVEAEWLAEAERRYAKFEAGETVASSAADALARVRARLRRR